MCERGRVRSVGRLCLVRFDGNKYSVMASAVGRPVEILQMASLNILARRRDPPPPLTTCGAPSDTSDASRSERFNSAAVAARRVRRATPIADCAPCGSPDMTASGDMTMERPEALEQGTVQRMNRMKLYGSETPDAIGPSERVERAPVTRSSPLPSNAARRTRTRTPAGGGRPAGCGDQRE